MIKVERKDFVEMFARELAIEVIKRDFAILQNDKEDEAFLRIWKSVENCLMYKYGIISVPYEDFYILFLLSSNTNQYLKIMDRVRNELPHVCQLSTKNS